MRLRRFWPSCKNAVEVVAETLESCAQSIGLGFARFGAVHIGPELFLIDSGDDVASLPSTIGTDPCAPGSIAYTPDLMEVYILGNDGHWYNAIITPESDEE